MVRISKASAEAVLKTAGRYAVVYVGWVVGAVLGGYALLKLWETITRVYSLLFPGSWGYGAVYMFSIVIVGLAWLIGALLLEDYYRKGIAAGDVRRRMVRVTVAELLAVVAVLPVRFFVS